MGHNLQLLKRYLEAWQLSREDACREYMTEDFECIEPPELPQGGVFRGYDAPIRITEIYTALWQIDILDMKFWDEPGSDVVVSRYVMKWTALKTGKSITEPVIELNHIRDGKISKMEVFHFDAHGLVDTLRA